VQELAAPQYGLHLGWGVNRWVLLEWEGGSIQQQVDSPGHLEAMLVEVGVPREDAHGLAREWWRVRPADAGMPSPRRREALWRSTGLRPGAAAILLGAFVVVAVLFWTLR
jgi:hypothetical protein